MKLDDETSFAIKNTKAITELLANCDASLTIGIAILSTLQPRKNKLKINSFDLMGVSEDNRNDLELILKAINKNKLTVLDMFGTEYINLLVIQHTQ